MKANFIVGKKQIILASLVLVLGVAVYLNWSFAKNGDEFKATDVATNKSIETALPGEIAGETGTEANGLIDVVNEETGEKTVGATPEEITVSTDGDATKVKHLGDAMLVNAKVIVDDNYFVKAKLARTRSRDEAIQTISAILDDEKLTESDKTLASQKAITITDVIEAESNIENLVKAKGYEECMVYISNGSASVVVKSGALDQTQATQIKNIVVTEGLIKGENVSITEIN